MALVYSGALAPEVTAAFEEIRQDIPGAGLLAVTSANRLHRGWRGNPGQGTSRVERLLAPLSSDAALVTVLDGHPLALSWLGGVRGQTVHALGVERFGQSGDIPDLYAEYRLDADAILDAAAAAVLARLRNRLPLLSQ